MRALLFALFVVQGCWSGNYIAQQGVGQLRLLQQRRRITEVLADPTVDATTREKLQLAKDARDFGVEVLGLRGGDSFTRFLDTGGAPVAWNVKAAEKDRLKVYRVTFPIVGTVPYLGYFREADARREAERLRARDLDVVVNPVVGFSTIGYFSDPIYSSMLEGPPQRIVEVVLHEMLHSTMYLPGKSEWNESLATFVGVEGAALFFRTRGGESAAQSVRDEANKRARNTEAFAAFLRPILKELQTLYESPISREEKLRRREPIFAAAQQKYRELFPPKPGVTPAFLREPLNNATLLGHAVYHQGTDDHRRLLRRVGGDLAAFVRLYRYALETAPEPLAWLKARQ